MPPYHQQNCSEKILSPKQWLETKQRLDEIRSAIRPIILTYYREEKIGKGEYKLVFCKAMKELYYVCKTEVTIPTAKVLEIVDRNVKQQFMLNVGLR